MATRVIRGQPEGNCLEMRVGPSNVANATEHYAAAGALVESVCVYVCMYVCMSGYAFRHALRYRAESWHWGIGDGPTRFVGIFSKRPHLGLKVIQGST